MKRTNRILCTLVLSIAVLASCGGGSGTSSGGTNPTPTAVYTVTYDGNGSTGGSVPIDTTNYEQGQTVTVLSNTGNLVETNYTFAGWNTMADGSGTTYTQGQTFTMGASNVTLYCKWTENPTYTVTYNGSGNTGGSVPIDSTNYEQGQTVTIPGNTGNLVKTGYTFSGWYVNGYAPLYTQGQTFTMGAANVIMYAGWTANPTYSVTYSGNGNTGGTVPVDSTTYQQGQTVTVLGNTGNLAKTGYTFWGWNTSANGTGTTYSQGSTFTMGSASVTLYANWVVAYTVTYNINMAIGGTVPVDSNKYQQGQTVTVLGNTGNLINPPFTFANWNTQPDQSGTSYTPGSTFTMGSSNVNLYAQWNCITYNPAGYVSGTLLAGCDLKFYNYYLPSGPGSDNSISSPEGVCILGLGYYTGDFNIWQNNQVLWSTNATYSPGSYWVFQSDGNLVVYDPSGKALWASNTSGHPGAYLFLGANLMNSLGQLSCRVTISDNTSVIFLIP
jgi:uncharacterized repeat protein (TIGR02543 family)